MAVSAGLIPDGLFLYRRDLFMCGRVTGRHTLSVYPPGKKKQNKIVVGDDSGAVVAFDVRKGVTTPAFKFVVPEGKVECVAVQPLRDASKTPNVFVSSGRVVRGISKAGKEFFSLASPLADPITDMRVCDARLWAAAGFTYNEFTQGRDTACAVCPDHILCMEVPPFDVATSLAGSGSESVNIVLGCADRFIRLVVGDAIVAQIGVEGAVTAIGIADSRPPPALSGKPPIWQLFYGTKNGYVGLVMVSGTVMQHAWSFASHVSLANPSAVAATAAAVNSLAVADLIGRKGYDLIVGRDDGSLEVYVVDPVPDATGTPATMRHPGPPRLLQLVAVDESIRGVVVAQVCTPGFNEIVVQTFTGKVISFTTEPLNSKDADDSYGRSKAVVQRESQIVALRKQIDDLKKKLATSQATLSTKMAKGGAAAAAAAAAATGTHEGAMPMSKYEAIHNLVLDPTDGTYTLTLEIPSPIESVMLQSTVPLDILDASDTSAEFTSLAALSAAATAATAVLEGATLAAPSAATVRATAAIISRTPVEGRTGGAALLATCRYQDATNRVLLRMRTVEGQHGELHALVVNKLAPKSATQVLVPIKPLSLHHRLLTTAADIESQLESTWSSYVASLGTLPTGSATTPPPTFPFCTLTISGTFTLGQMHEWVSNCLPDVPLRLAAEGPTEISLAFKNVFLGSHLTATYRKGSAVFKSDSPTVIAILKEVISNAATGLKMRLTTSVDVPRYALRRVVSLLHQKLHFALTLQRRVELIDAVRELADTDAGPDKTFLHPEFVDILENAERLQRVQASRPRMFEYMMGILTDAFVDFHKFRGRDVISKVGELHAQLQAYHTRQEDVLQYMETA